MSIVKLMSKFKTQEQCISYLEKKRWNGKVICPYCQSSKVGLHIEKEQSTRRQCQSCQRSFSVLVGTIFESSKLPLIKWFMAIALIVEAKKGISSLQLSRNLDITYKTAWSIAHKIRKALQQDKSLFGGIVEMDETYIKTTKNDKDDNDKNGRIGRGTNQTAIFGIANKGSNIRAFVLNNVKTHTLLDITMNNVIEGSEIHTDEFTSYKGFNMFYKHKSVNHSKEYVSANNITTNSVEGFWSLLKRGIKGQFHYISKKYLQRYINEFSYRYNQRKQNNEFIFEDVLGRMLGV